jgi:hypothetical protein
MIETYLFALFTVAVIGLVTLVLILKKKYNRLLLTIGQLIFDKGMLLERIEKLELENSKEANDGFIKFLSQSRDAAFKYIEDVQVALQNYVSAVNSGKDDEIQIARMELFSHLPESSQTGDQDGR